MIPTVDEFARRWVAKATDMGADPEALIRGQVENLAAVSGTVIAALTGGERELLHLQAQFGQATFSAEAEAWLEASAWREALVELIEDVFSAMLDAGVKLAGKALVAALEKGLAS